MTSWIEDLGLTLIGTDVDVVFTSSVWDAGASIWDSDPTTWDSLTTGWDDGTTSWDSTAPSTWDGELAQVLPPAPGQGDILIAWDNLNGIGDWQLADGDLMTGQDLETACLVSLFTDRLATPDFVPTDGTTNRRGWWADPYNDQPLGSNLWQLDRAKKTRDTLGLARTYAREALQWLVDDGVADTIAVNTAWLGRQDGSTILGIAIAISKPDGSMTRFAFGWAWENLATLALPADLAGPQLALRALAPVRRR